MNTTDLLDYGGVGNPAPGTPVIFQSSGWLDDILIRICVALQLTPTQYTVAEAHYIAVSKWLAANESPLASVSQEIFPQGSLRIGTTVRPWWQEEYDLDLVLRLDLWQELDPVYLLNIVEQRLRHHSTYAPRVERKNRCIRVNFAKQFHLDILPARPDARLGGTHVLVPDRTARCWKESNPKGYALWFEERGALMSQMHLLEKRATVQPLPAPEGAEDKNALQLCVQLLKRGRDIRFAGNPDLAPISVVLTTLAGERYAGERHPIQALNNVVQRIVVSIPSTGRLVVCNPANPYEDLSERWDENPGAYQAFVSWMVELERDLAALQQLGVPEASRCLERLFGDAAPRAIRGQAEAVEKARRSSQLGVTRTGAITTAVSSSVVPVKRNTFYGK
jgi:Second Messenger Oligonucleotide or Dinucleotide Synthetase domain